MLLLLKIPWMLLKITFLILWKVLMVFALLVVALVIMLDSGRPQVDLR